MEEWKRTPVATCEALVNFMPKRIKAVLENNGGTQNIDTLGPIWTFSLRVVLTFVASGLDINGCVLSYFEGTEDVHRYTSCTLTTLHCSKVSFLQCCHMKRYNKIFTKMWRCTHFCEILYMISTKTISSTAFFSLIIMRHFSWASNQYIRMVSEGSCDTEDWSNDGKNAA